MLHTLFRDLVQALRRLRKRPGLAFLAISALAMGIGLTTAMFGITNGLLLNGLPFEEGERIQSIIRSRTGLNAFLQTVPIREYAEWEARQSSFEELAAFTFATFNVAGEEKPERLIGAGMTVSAFTALRVPPLLGRSFSAEDEVPGAPRVALISYVLWRDRFELDQNVLGRTLKIDGFESVIIGVMPEGFEFPFTQRVWTPLQLDPLNAAPGEGQLRVFGRLAAGVTLKQAQAEFDAIAANLAAEFPETNEGVTIRVRPYVEQFVGPQARPLLLLMLLAVFFVMLIACANVANLLLAQAVARSRDVAIRMAVGASRSRLIMSQLIEVFLLAIFGGVGGFLVAQLGITLFYNAITQNNLKPFWLVARIEPEVLLFVVFLMLVATLVAGLLPAFRATRADVADVLKDEARGSSGLKLGRLSRWLVIGEIAVSAALLVGAGMMVKSVANLASFEYAFNTKNVFTTSVTLGDGDYESQEARLRFFDDLESRVRTVPGVTTAGVATELPVVGAAQAAYEIEGKPFESALERPVARLAAGSPGMFEVFDVPLLEGRPFNSSDLEASLPVALVNRSFVGREFAGESPVGQRLRIFTLIGEPQWITIVGVIEDMHLGEQFSIAAPAGIYVPLEQWGAVSSGAQGVFALSLIARTERDPTAITPQIRAIVAELNPDLPLSRSLSFEQLLAQTYAGIVAVGSSFAIFGLVALFLSAVGLFGVMSFSTSQRTREVGIRMAFGATQKSAFALILRDAGKQLAIGLVAGLALGLGLAHALQFALFEVEPVQPGIMLGVAIILAFVALAASAIPAWRASRVDPLVAIRYEV